MKNNLADLNNSLFIMLENLCDDKILKNPSKLDAEIKRTHAACKVSSEILNIAKVQVSALRVAEECGYNQNELPALIAVKDSREQLTNRKTLLIGGKE